MSDPRAEQADREAEAWAAFEAAVNAVPRSRWDETGVLDGWTLKELLWHVAGWLQKCARNLEARRTDADVAGSGLTVDERNAQLAAEARDLDADAVWAGVVEARASVRRGWDELATIDRTAIRELADETYEHYAEHLPDLAAFAG